MILGDESQKLAASNVVNTLASSSLMSAGQLFEGTALYSNKPKSQQNFKKPFVSARYELCGYKGHVREECYREVGFPKNFVSKKKINKYMNAHNVFEDAEASKSSFDDKSVTLTKGQYDQLINLLQKNTFSSSPVAHTAELINSTSMTHSDELVFYVESNETECIIDTGATNHMSSSLKVMHKTAETGKARKVFLPNADVSVVTRTCSYFIAGHNMINNVLVIPQFRKKLLFVSQVTNELNCSVTFMPDLCVFQDVSTWKVRMVGRERNGIYVLSSQPQKEKIQKFSNKTQGLEGASCKVNAENVQTWHERLSQNQQERHENAILGAEIEKYMAERGLQLQEGLNNNASNCPTSDGPTTLGEITELLHDEHKVKLENARPAEEVDRVSAIGAKRLGKPAIEAAKPFIMQLAVTAMDELVEMAIRGEPLWFLDIVDGTILLNEEEYARLFPRTIGPNKPGFKTEVSRETAIVNMNRANLVKMLMDVDHRESMFSNIVSNAVMIDVLSTGVSGKYNEALQVISAEFQVPSPEVPTRDCYFLRYCKQLVDGIWAVVEASVDHLRGIPTARCRKRPSGCLIQEMPDGHSKVTWIEHVEADDTAVYSLYKPLVNSGLAFGAKRWIATLDRQCQRLASAMTENMLSNDIRSMVIRTPEQKKSILKLTERMLISFCSGVSASTAHQWTPLSGIGSDDCVRFMFRKSVNDPGRPSGIVLSAATSFWLPVDPQRVFHFLRDENTRGEWDLLSNGGIVHEVAYMANGSETGNRVSILRVESANSSQSNMLILQESSTDPSGSFVVYAPVEVSCIHHVLNGEEPDHVPLLPSGFAILPEGSPGDKTGSGGSLVTVAFQIYLGSIPTTKLSNISVALVDELIACTINRIKVAVLSDPYC